MATSALKVGEEAKRTIGMKPEEEATVELDIACDTNAFGDVEASPRCAEGKISRVIPTSDPEPVLLGALIDSLTWNYVGRTASEVPKFEMTYDQPVLNGVEKLYQADCEDTRVTGYSMNWDSRIDGGKVVETLCFEAKSGKIASLVSQENYPFFTTPSS